MAWTLAMMKPGLVEKLIVLNLPHPRGLAREGPPAQAPAVDLDVVPRRDPHAHGGALAVDPHPAGGDPALELAPGSVSGAGQDLLQLLGFGLLPVSPRCS